MKIIKHSSISFYAVAICAFLLVAACTDNFATLNTDKNSVTVEAYKQENSLAKALLEYAGNWDYSYETWRVNIIYGSLIMQHCANNSWYSGDKYFLNTDFAASYFHVAYVDQVKYIQDIIKVTKGDTLQRKLYNMARIARALIMHRLTDIYGDVPYFEGGTGTTFTPKYDSQEAIYSDMLSELADAAKKLGTDATTVKGDLLYGGNPEKWKKFAYSLMLRLAMRLVKIKPDEAKKYAEIAAAGGCFTSNDDNAKIAHQAGSRFTVNRINNILGNEWDATGTHSAGKQDIFLSKTLVDFLKNNNDPRLGILSVIRHNDDADPAKQIGMPNGHDASGGINPINNDPNYPGKALDHRNGSTDSVYAYSTINPKLLGADAPTVFLGYAEVELLLAEAAKRGYTVTGTAQSHYEAGVKAAMQQFTQYNSTLTIPDAAITAYLAGNKRYNDANAMYLINEQYWAATFFNWYETWANWRRTEIPTLTPVNYKGNDTGGTIPRRMTYPVSEASTNADNFNAAIKKLTNGNTLTGRVWWDR